MRGGDFQWPQPGTFGGHQRGRSHGHGHRADVPDRRQAFSPVASALGTEYHLKMIYPRILALIAADLSWTGGEDDPLVQAYVQLERALAAYFAGGNARDERAETLSRLEAIASQSLGVVLATDDLWIVLQTLRSSWSREDNLYVEQILQHQSDDFYEAEFEVLRSVGVPTSSCESLLLSAAAFGQANEIPPEPEHSRRRTEELRDEIEQQRMREEYEEERRERRFQRRLRMIGRATHVVGGGLLMLADVGGISAVAISTPLALLGAGPVGIVSIKKGSDLMRLGSDDQY